MPMRQAGPAEPAARATRLRDVGRLAAGWCAGCRRRRARGGRLIGRAEQRRRRRRRSLRRRRRPSAVDLERIGARADVGRGPVRDRGQPALVERGVAELDQRLGPAAVVPGQHRRRQAARGLARGSCRRRARPRPPRRRRRGRRPKRRRGPRRSVVGGSCIRSPTTITCCARCMRRDRLLDRDLARLVVDHDVEQAGSSGSVSDTDVGLISQIGRRAATTVAGVAGREVADRLVAHRLAELVLELAAAGRPRLLVGSRSRATCRSRSRGVGDPVGRTRARTRAMIDGRVGRVQARQERPAPRRPAQSSRSPSSRARSRVASVGLVERRRASRRTRSRRASTAQRAGARRRPRDGRRSVRKRPARRPDRRRRRRIGERVEHRPSTSSGTSSTSEHEPGQRRAGSERGRRRPSSRARSPGRVGVVGEPVAPARRRRARSHARIACDPLGEDGGVAVAPGALGRLRPPRRAPPRASCARDEPLERLGHVGAGRRRRSTDSRASTEPTHPSPVAVEEPEERALPAPARSRARRARRRAPSGCVPAGRPRSSASASVRLRGLSRPGRPGRSVSAGADERSQHGAATAARERQHEPRRGPRRRERAEAGDAAPGSPAARARAPRGPIAPRRRRPGRATATSASGRGGVEDLRAR